MVSLYLSSSMCIIQSKLSLVTRLGPKSRPGASVQLEQKKFRLEKSSNNKRRAKGKNFLRGLGGGRGSGGWLKYHEKNTFENLYNKQLASQTMHVFAIAINYIGKTSYMGCRRIQIFRKDGWLWNFKNRSGNIAFRQKNSSW